MKNVTIYHNPRCSKSRQAMAHLESMPEVELTVVQYLKTPLDKAQIVQLLEKLHCAPIQLMRTKEAAFKELNLNSSDADDVLISAMVQEPKLIERPVIVVGEKAVIARPLENINEIL